LNRADDQAWIRTWIAERGDGAKAPLCAYPGALRAMQGYLAKMPADWVERWSELRLLADSLADVQDDLSNIKDIPPLVQAAEASAFRPKDETEYVAFLMGGRQVRTRHHERLVRLVGEHLQQCGAVVSTHRRIDLLMTAPAVVIFEAKTVGSRDPSFAVREAIGQLLEYRHYLGPTNAALCIILDKPPAPHTVDFVEGAVGMMLAWMDGDKMLCGPTTGGALPFI
jgi:hypothetical protein